MSTPNSPPNQPCAACKCLRRKCTEECIFAPYFPANDHQKFIDVHKVFGASNVSKLLNELNAANREDAVNSLVFEAKFRLIDPVYGCVGPISVLQKKLKQLNQDLDTARKELAKYIGPSAMLPIINHQGLMQQQQQQSNHHLVPCNFQPPMQQQQLDEYLDAQQIVAAAAREQEMMRTFEQLRQNEMMRCNRVGFEEGVRSVFATGFNQTGIQQQQQKQTEIMIYNSGVFEEGGTSVTATGFNQMEMQQQQQKQKELMILNAGVFEEGGSSATATGFNQMGMQQQNEVLGYNNNIRIDEMDMDMQQQPWSAMETSYEAIPYHVIQVQQQLENTHLHPHHLQQQQQNASTSHQQELQQFSRVQVSHTQQKPPQATSEEDRNAPL